VEEDYTLGTYCQNVLHSLPLHGVIILSGLHTSTTLNAWDESALTYALEHIFQSHHPLPTSFTYTADTTGEGMRVEFVTYVPTELFGLDGLDPDNLHAAYEVAVAVLSRSMSSGSFVTNVDQYLSQHQNDGHVYELYDHGSVQLLSVHEEHTWRNYLPETYSPSSVPTALLSPTPSSTPPDNTTGTAGHPSSSSHASSHASPSSSSVPVPLIIGFFVICGVALIFYLNRSSSSSQKKGKQQHQQHQRGGRKSMSDRQDGVYNELSTSSHHRGDPLYDEEDDEGDEEDEENPTEDEEERDIEVFSFTECIEDPRDELKTKKFKKKSPSSSAGIRGSGPSPSAGSGASFALVPSAAVSASSQLLKAKNPIPKPVTEPTARGKKSKKMKSQVPGEV
jgi:hypothetical protein